MEHIEFIPKGVCASKIQFDLDNGKIYNLEITGGCNGNGKAVAKLVEGQDSDHIAELLKDNLCGFRGTSCADQLSIAITEAKRKFATSGGK